MGMRVNPSLWNSRHAADSGEFLRRLEAQTGLLIGADVAKFHPIRIPLIHRSLVHQTRRPVLEPAVNALLPEVCRFNNMGVRRDKCVGSHTNLPPVYGAVGSSL